METVSSHSIPTHHKATFLAAGMIIAFVLLGWMTLHDYGMNWDEGLGDLFFGDRYWQFFRSGIEAKYLNFDEPNIKYYAWPGQVDFHQSPWRTHPEHYWPVANMFVASYGELFNRRIPLFDPIDARHAGVVVLAAMSLAAVWSLAREVHGVRPALFAMLLLALHPNFWGHAHNNLKDMGECAFYSWTLVCAYRGILRRDVRWMIATGVFWGLAMGTKLNAVFALVTLLVWLAVLILLQWRRGIVWPDRKWSHLLMLIGVPLIGGLVYFIAWPWLWADPVGRLKLHLNLFLERATEGPGRWQWYPIWEAIVATPPFMLVTFPVGILFLFRDSDARRKWPASLLIALWFAIPILRSMPPTIINFDGIRHFIEFLPAAAIIGGCGLHACCRWIEGRSRSARHGTLATTTLCAVVFGTAAWANIESHPFQTAYVNVLGSRHFIPDYWCQSYRVGCQWINEHAEENATVSTPIADHLLRMAGPVWLRPGLRFEEKNKSPPSPGSPPRYVLLVNRPGWLREWPPLLAEQGQLVHTMVYREWPMLWIYRVPATADSPTPTRPS